MEQRLTREEIREIEEYWLHGSDWFDGDQTVLMGARLTIVDLLFHIKSCSTDNQCERENVKLREALDYAIFVMALSKRGSASEWAQVVNVAIKKARYALNLSEDLTRGE